jgi:hypothetical protein
VRAWSDPGRADLHAFELRRLFDGRALPVRHRKLIGRERRRRGRDPRRLVLLAVSGLHIGRRIGLRSTRPMPG